MNVRTAKITDAGAIYALINQHAEREKLLFRSKADIYENLQSFFVAQADTRIVGCCALQIVWSDLAEIKSLAVDSTAKGTGIGTMLVTHAATCARDLGLPKIFALTLEPDFFQKLGFQIVQKDTLPMKVWSDCATCPKQENCDEIAVILPLGTNTRISSEE